MFGGFQTQLLLGADGVHLRARVGPRTGPAAPVTGEALPGGHYLAEELAPEVTTRLRAFFNEHP